MKRNIPLKDAKQWEKLHARDRAYFAAHPGATICFRPGHPLEARQVGEADLWVVVHNVNPWTRMFSYYVGARFCGSSVRVDTR